MEARLEEIAGIDGRAIPTRVWDVDRGGREATPVIMTHGLQSHSGLFARSQAHLASLGLPVYAFDRRGSGLSREPRGDCRDFGELIDDVLAVAEQARKDYGADRVHVFGHCFGALTATAFACRHPERTRTLVLATPGLYTHADLRFVQKLRLAWWLVSRREQRFPVPFDVDMLSELPDCVATAREDPLSLTDATARLFFQVPRLRSFITRKSSALTMPVLMACAGPDPICDNARNRAYFAALPSPAKRLLDYPDARHVLEWSTARDAFFADLRTWFEGEGRA